MCCFKAVSTHLQENKVLSALIINPDRWRCWTLMGQSRTSPHTQTQTNTRERRYPIASRAWQAFWANMWAQTDRKTSGRSRALWYLILQRREFLSPASDLQGVSGPNVRPRPADLRSVLRRPSVRRGTSALIWVKTFSHVTSGLFGSTKSGILEWEEKKHTFLARVYFKYMLNLLL